MAERTCQAPFCTRGHYAKGWCKLHYRRVGANGTPDLRQLPSVAARFWAKVNVSSPDNCWEWTASVDRHGYGQFFPPRDGDRKTSVRAHRWAYAEMVGPIPAGRDLLHRCDNPLCVNPAHLWPGTHAENMADMAAKGRSDRIAKVRGEKHPNARLTWCDVEYIRSARAAGTDLVTLGNKFGVTKSNISHIARGRTWVVRPI